MRSYTSAAVYGTITVGAILAAESAASETYGETVASVFVAILIFWLAGAYSDFTEERLLERQGFTLGGFVQALAHEVTIVLAAGIPLLVLIIGWAAGVPRGSAVTAAIWTSAVMVVIVEVVVGIRAKLTGHALAAHTALGALFGLLIIALKLILHH